MVEGRRPVRLNECAVFWLVFTAVVFRMDWAVPYFMDAFAFWLAVQEMFAVVCVVAAVGVVIVRLGEFVVTFAFDSAELPAWSNAFTK